MKERQWTTALESTRAYQIKHPSSPELAKFEWSILITLGNIEGAVSRLDEYAQIEAFTPSLHACYIFALQASSQASAEDIRQAYSDCSKQHFATDRYLPQRVPKAPKRIGILSGEMRDHAASKFLKPLIQALTLLEIEVIAFSTSQLEDERSTVIKNLCNQWHSLANVSTGQATETIQNKEPDLILSCDWLLRHSRLDIARELTPSILQIDYLQAGTTGIPQIPFRITDAWLDPPAEDGYWLDQKCIYLPGGTHVFERPTNTIEPKIERSHNHSIFIGSFNHLCKINDRVIHCWSQILQQCPQAKLLLKASHLDLPEIQSQLKKRFNQLGIEENQLCLLGFAPNSDLHLKLYNRLSIALDTFPYNGVTTSCEALWMGVPLVTLEGDRPIARKGASLLHQIGATELITKDEDTYIAKVISLIQNEDQRQYYHRNLRSQMIESPLCDIKRMAYDFKNAF